MTWTCPECLRGVARPLLNVTSPSINKYTAMKSSRCLKMTSPLLCLTTLTTVSNSRTCARLSLCRHLNRKIAVRAPTLVEGAHACARSDLATARQRRCALNLIRCIDSATKHRGLDLARWRERHMAMHNSWMHRQSHKTPRPLMRQGALSSGGSLAATFSHRRKRDCVCMCSTPQNVTNCRG